MRYLKFEASGNHLFIRKLTGHSETTVRFVILTDLFYIERWKQEEDLKEFSGIFTLLTS